jgi:hypothetical protein
MTTHELSAPLSIDMPVHPATRPLIRVRLAGIGQQHVWLNTVEVVTEDNRRRSPPTTTCGRRGW